MMKKSTIQFSIIFLTVCFFAFFVFSQVAFAECTSETSQPNWITCMDYDGASPPVNWPVCGGASWQNWQVMGWDCSNPDYFNPLPGISALSTATKYSGTRSLMLGKQAGCHAATQTWFDWSATHPGVTKLHIRMYVYFDSSWTSFDGDPDNYWHFILLNTGAWTVGIDIGDVTDERPWNVICYNGDNGQYLRFRDPADSSPQLLGPTNAGDCWNIETHTNAWHAHEWMWEIVSPGNYHVKHWVDGVLHADRTWTGGSTISSWINMHLDQWLSTGDGVAQEVKLYVDNIVIATDYIGPIGGTIPDTTPPSPPTNVRVN